MDYFCHYLDRIQFNKKIGRSATQKTLFSFYIPIQFNKKIGRSATIQP